MTAKTHFTEIEGRSPGYLALLAGLVVLIGGCLPLC